MIQIPIERREEAIPEGYVKVVRCKDCYWREKGFDLQRRCTLLGIYPTREWYCANGISRKDYLARLEEKERKKEKCSIRYINDDLSERKEETE